MEGDFKKEKTITYHASSRTLFPRLPNRANNSLLETRENDRDLGFDFQPFWNPVFRRPPRMQANKEDRNRGEFIVSYKINRKESQYL